MPAPSTSEAQLKFIETELSTVKRDDVLVLVCHLSYRTHTVSAYYIFIKYCVIKHCSCALIYSCLDRAAYLESCTVLIELDVLFSVTAGTPRPCSGAPWRVFTSRVLLGLTEFHILSRSAITHRVSHVTCICVPSLHSRFVCTRLFCVVSVTYPAGAFQDGCPNLCSD